METQPPDSSSTGTARSGLASRAAEAPLQPWRPAASRRAVVVGMLRPARNWRLHMAVHEPLGSLRRMGAVRSHRRHSRLSLPGCRLLPRKGILASGEQGARCRNCGRVNTPTLLVPAKWPPRRPHAEPLRTQPHCDESPFARMRKSRRQDRRDSVVPASHTIFASAGWPHSKRYRIRVPSHRLGLTAAVSSSDHAGDQPWPSQISLARRLSAR